MMGSCAARLRNCPLGRGGLKGACSVMGSRAVRLLGLSAGLGANCPPGAPLRPAVDGACSRRLGPRAAAETLDWW